VKIINQYQDLNNSDIDNNKNSPIKKKPTTDINILLNRVKLDEKKDLKKRLIFLGLLLMIISFVTFFAIG
jgi:hypothetical protein